MKYTYDILDKATGLVVDSISSDTVWPKELALDYQTEQYLLKPVYKPLT